MYNKLISIILILSSIFCTYILFLTLQTFIGMFDLQFKSKTDFPIDTSEKFDKNFTGYPPINTSSIPLIAYKGALLLREGKYDLAVQELKRASEVNPYIGYSDFILGNYFYSMGNIDSSYFYANKAFKLWPKSINNFNLLNKINAFRGDTISIINSYIEIKDFFTHRKEYYDSFIKYYSFGKFYYYNIEYDDKREITSNQLIGEWVQVFNMKDGSIRVMKDRKIEFLSNGFFKSNSSFYLLDKVDNYYTIRFQDRPDKVISTFTAAYSDKWETLILNFNNASEDKDQFFKRVSELNLQN